MRSLLRNSLRTWFQEDMKTNNINIMNNKIMKLKRIFMWSTLQRLKSRISFMIKEDSIDLARSWLTSSESEIESYFSKLNTLRKYPPTMKL